MSPSRPTTPMPLRASIWIACIALGLPASGSAEVLNPGGPLLEQDPPKEEQEDKQQGDKRLEAWPEVDDAAVKLDIERLRKARTPEMGSSAKAALIERGAGVVPAVLEKYGKEKGKPAITRMEAVLTAVTGAPHTRLLSTFFEHKSMTVRIWTLERVASFPDAGVREAAEKAHEAASKRKRGKDPVEVLNAAMCCASSGSFVGFEELMNEAHANWEKHRELLHGALSSLRGPEATKRVGALLSSDDRKSKQTGLRLLSACGDKKSATAMVTPFLDDSDNSLRIGAINALRGIIDGDPPLPKLSVFKAIEEANKWKARL